jgi:hypothetical protein
LIILAQGHQSLEAVHARHIQVQQHQVDLRPAAEDVPALPVVAGLEDFGDAQGLPHRLGQGAANQRMVVGDQHGMAGLVEQWVRLRHGRQV